MNARNAPATQAAPVTKDEYAQRWGISTRSLDRLIDQGLPVIKLGHRTVRIVPQSADEFLRRRFSK